MADAGSWELDDYPIGRQLLAMLSDRTRNGLRQGSRTYPIIVLTPGGPGVPAGEYLDKLRAAAARMNIPHAAPALPIAPDATDPDPKIAILREIAKPTAWLPAQRSVPRLTFRRSDLVTGLGAHPHETGRVLRGHVWSGAIAFAAAVISGIAQGIAGTVPLWLLLGDSALVLIVALVIGYVVAQLSAPEGRARFLARAGAGSRYRWLATSSFFAVLGGYGYDERRRLVVERLAGKSGDEPEYVWQVRTFAFLEDLRAAYQRLTPSLRGFKRHSVPVLFLKGITEANGGEALLQAISDIRSRRSEFHPLLVIATEGEPDGTRPPSGDGTGPAASQERAGEPEPTRENGRVRLSVADEIKRWEESLGTAQAPSGRPYVLPITIPDQQPDEAAKTPLKPRRRPPWTWLWSRWSAAGLAVILVVGGASYNLGLNATYCHVGLPFSANTDTWKVTDADGSIECVGVATDGVRFESTADSVGLDGHRRLPTGGPLAGTHGAFTLADLQRRIAQENTRVLTSGKPYVTIMYAGPLTAAAGQDQATITTLHELAGAYLAQYANNGTGEAGTIASKLEIRLLPVNTGGNMAFSGQVADRMLAIARADPTVIGVVGMGRNTRASYGAITRLSDAGLAVLSTVNSSDKLPQLRNYYGLASTDHDEATAAAHYLARALPPIRHAMIVSRSPGPPGDNYSVELAADMGAQLHAGTTTPVQYDDPNDVNGQVSAACGKVTPDDPYDFIYFAGRAEDLNGLVNALNNNGCTDRHMTLVGGDEMSRVRYGSGPYNVLLPPSVTTYYTTFNYLPTLTAGHRDQTVPFFVLAHNRFGIGPGQQSLLADGQMPLAYDATAALATAARAAYTGLGLSDKQARVPGSSTVSAGSVLLELPSITMGGATGTIDFGKDATHALNGPGDHGLTLVEVSVAGSAPQYQPMCGRLNGGEVAGTLQNCP